MVCLVGGDITFDSINKRVICGPELGAVGVGGVISGARVGRARVEVSGADERLTNQPRAYDGSIPVEKLAVGLIRKNKLRERSHNQRIQDSQQDGGCDRHENGCDEMFFHFLLLCQFYAR